MPTSWALGRLFTVQQQRLPHKIWSFTRSRSDAIDAFPRANSDRPTSVAVSNRFLFGYVHLQKMCSVDEAAWNCSDSLRNCLRRGRRFLVWQHHSSSTPRAFQFVQINQWRNTTMPSYRTSRTLVLGYARCDLLLTRCLLVHAYMRLGVGSFISAHEILRFS